ncbi:MULTISPECIES: helix-hairpin-helix domain-containing protein [Carnobacterium]|uniref:Competence protein ComEA n=2 Tax=Carnobacterium inhibens TaxID=147709 RepID=U5S8A3_9LACT|nr:helix-hairpin-helix domain-containing protein [Carnobacterium inhibens]AGY81494.1 competence protein ComEA [Carnobacterium inhibens subsp. gilichinskyi]MBC9824993.1 competence protein ComEA [Carnobacterium inhibens]MCM3512755.1 helix-hairpin-helix domain-containing protein [Carnobacterium inhibens]
MLKTGKEWLIKYRLAIEIGVFCCLIISVLGISFLLFKNSNSVEEQSMTMSYLQNDRKSSVELESVDHVSESSVEKIYVDVKGAVYLPGVYEVTSDMRLIDAVDLAGGFSEEADQTPVNLSLKLADQMVIFIPKLGDSETLQTDQETQVASMEENVITVPEGSSEPNASTKVNINLADASELQQLSGIGEKKAEQIVTYRQDNGSFQKIEELKNVSGIGEKTFEAIQSSITVGNE